MGYQAVKMICLLFSSGVLNLWSINGCVLYCQRSEDKVMECEQYKKSRQESTNEPYGGLLRDKAPQNGAGAEPPEVEKFMLSDKQF